MRPAHLRPALGRAVVGSGEYHSVVPRRGFCPATRGDDAAPPDPSPCRETMDYNEGCRRWLFLILGIPAIMYTGAALAGTIQDPFPFEPWYQVFLALALALFLGPVEELGWRGLALPLLQRKYARWDTYLLAIAAAIMVWVHRDDVLPRGAGVTSVFSKDTHQGRRPRRPTSYPHVEALQRPQRVLPIDDHSWPRTPTPDNVHAATGKQKATPPDYGGCVRPSGGDPHTTWQRRLLPPSAVGPLSRYCPNISAYRAAATPRASWSTVTGSCSALRTLSST